MSISTRKALGLLALSASLLFAGCSDDITTTTPINPDDAVVETAIKAKLPAFEMQSRAAINPGENSISWRDGDRLSVFYYPQDDAPAVNMNFALTSVRPDMGEGLFAGNASAAWSKEAEKHLIYSVYPFSADNNDITAIKVTLPEKVSAKTAKSAEAGMFLVGESECDKIDGPVAMDMESPLRLLHIILNTEHTLLNGSPAKQVTLTAGDAIVGEAFYNIPEKKFTGFDKQAVSVEFEDGETFEGMTHLYFYINPEAELTKDWTKLSVDSDLFEAEFTFDVTTDNSDEIIVLDVQKALEANMGTLELKDTKVSALEANSYMLKCGSHMIIPCSRAYYVWKNMLGTPLDPAAFLDYKIMWIDTDGGLSPEGTLHSVSMVIHDENDGNSAGIFVKAGSRPGNALVALVADDEIVWSWHIWVSDYDPSVKNNQIGTFIFMDRNLGAVNTIPGDVGSKGYAYQWGRKDPFPCHDPLAPVDPFYLNQHRSWWDGEGNMLIHGDADFQGTEEQQKANGLLFAPVLNDGGEIAGVIHATKNPTTFLYFEDGSEPQCVLWTSRAFMLPYQLLNVLWDTAGSSIGKKAVFDPCPPGWRVPNDISFLYDLMDKAGVVPADLYGDPPKVNPYDASNPFFAIGTGRDFGSCGYFPAMGYMEGQGGYGGGWMDDGLNAGYWIATPGGFGGRGFYFNRNAKGLDDYMISTYRSTGLGVRCVKE